MTGQNWVELFKMFIYKSNIVPWDAHANESNLKKIDLWRISHANGNTNILKPGAHSTRLISWNHFCSNVSMCVCVSAPEGINNQWHVWCNMGHVWLIKPILQFFRKLPLIKWKSVALVTQYVMHTRQRCWSWRLTSHRRRHINYLVVATRQSTADIKVRGLMRSDEFKRWLGFSFTVKI